MDILKHACMVVNPGMVDNFASHFHCLLFLSLYVFACMSWWNIFFYYFGFPNFWERICPFGFLLVAFLLWYRCFKGVLFSPLVSMRTEFLCISALRVASGPRVKLASCKGALTPPPVVYSTDRSKVVVPVLVFLFVALWFILWGDLFYVLHCVILFLRFSVLCFSLDFSLTFFLTEGVG